MRGFYLEKDMFLFSRHLVGIMALCLMPALNPVSTAVAGINDGALAYYPLHEGAGKLASDSGSKDHVVELLNAPSWQGIATIKSYWLNSSR